MKPGTTPAHTDLARWLAGRPEEARRMYAVPEGAADWREIASSPLYAGMVNEVREEGLRLQRDPIPELTPALYALFETTGNRLSYEAVYFDRRRRLATFALLHFIYPEAADYREALAAIIDAIVAEPTWCLPAHMRGQRMDRHIDLFAAETGFAFSEILALTGDGLPPALRARMREQIDRRLLVPYLTHGPYHWETAEHNWAAICAGSIGAAALLVEADTARLAEIVAKAVGTLGHYLSGFGADGACPEGPGYWNYGFGYFVYFADLLHRATAGQANLFDDDKVRSIARFQLSCYLVGSRPANFSDAIPEIRVQIGLSDELASRFEAVEHPPLAARAHFTDDACSRFAHALRSFLWFRPHADRQADWPPGSRYLPDAQWLVSRCAGQEGRFGFAAKGGHNLEPHNHIDVGHFMLLADGDPAFAADLGSGEYTAQYFGEGRYSYDCTGAQGHSLPIVGGALQRPGADSAAVVLEAFTGTDEDRFALDLTACYDASASGLALFERRFRWLKSGLPSLELEDTFRFREAAGQVTEVVVTRCEPRLLEDGRILLQGERRDAVLLFDPGRFRTTIEQRPFVNHFGGEERYYRIQLAADGEWPAGTGLRIALRFQFQRKEDTR